MSCYHCGLPVPARESYPVTINGREELMCCIGCQAVATAIVEGGLESFYRFRTEINSRPDEEQVSALERWRVYDLPEVQSEFVLELDEQRSQASLLLENITCAACSWLIEKHLRSQPGVRSVTVNMAKIGRASCRERVEVSVGGGALDKRRKKARGEDKAE